LLVNSERTKVAAVAEAIGYESEAAFSRAFKRSAGVTPADGGKGPPDGRRSNSLRAKVDAIGDEKWRAAIARSAHEAAGSYGSYGNTCIIPYCRQPDRPLL
jgi:AraC-like DNA-binding protein